MIVRLSADLILKTLFPMFNMVWPFLFYPLLFDKVYSLYATDIIIFTQTLSYRLTKLQMYTFSANPYTILISDLPKPGYHLATVYLVDDMGIHFPLDVSILLISFSIH